MNLQTFAPSIWDVWLTGNYHRAASLLATAYQQQPSQSIYQHYLGLAYILQGRPDEAHKVWQLNQVNAQQILELIQILSVEAIALEKHEYWRLALRIRQEISEINEHDIDNQLHCLFILSQLDQVAASDVSRLATLLNSNRQQNTDTHKLSLDTDLLLQVAQDLLRTKPEMPEVLDLVQGSRVYVLELEPWVELLWSTTKDLQGQQQPVLACQYAQICLDLDSENLSLIRDVVWLFALYGNLNEAIALSEKLANKSQRFLDQMLQNTISLHASQRLGQTWEVREPLLQRQLELLKTLIKNPREHDPLEILEMQLLTRSLFSQPYLSDCPEEHHALRQQVGHFIETNLKTYLEQKQETYSPLSNKPLALPKQKRKLRIGYIGVFLRRHSVGWIARWLYMHHNHEQFEIYTYFHKQSKIQYFSRDCFANYSEKWRTLNDDIVETARTIQADDIDILVDVDSITSGSTYGVMALKSAPIQVTWLGWDAPGLSTIDYFIADPYVLPQSAQDYYTEKIWRLPQTYLAVTGFEVDFPSRRREDLGIPTNAIVYLSNQNSIKRQDNFIRVQLQVIKQVENSYFLIKLWGDSPSLRQYFYELAEDEGVTHDRLRFLPLAPTESLYRGNLTLADVVLDSYPYSGATTTLETLWVGLPLVTKVGEQFASRNSYTMMMNAGIEEGIAWTDEEYIGWAVKFGTDESLRKQVFNKLMRSRHTAPLWNAKQFTKEMENAYQQMWANYLESQP